MEWMLLYLMKNPDWEKKIFNELKSLTADNGRRINLDDRTDAHFTNAFIDEVTRHCEMGIFPPSRKTREDVVFQGKKYPKGTQVCSTYSCLVSFRCRPPSFPLHQFGVDDPLLIFFQVLFSMYLINYDEKHFPNPHKFMPERFLDKDGNYKRDEHVIFFGHGRRRCPGEQLARSELFLFVTNVVQQFKLVPGQELTYDSRPGQVFYPVPYKFSFQEREDVNFE